MSLLSDREFSIKFFPVQLLSKKSVDADDELIETLINFAGNQSLSQPIRLTPKNLELLKTTREQKLHDVTYGFRKALQANMKLFVSEQNWSLSIFCAFWLQHVFDAKAKPNQEFNGELTVTPKLFNSDVIRDLQILTSRLGYGNPKDDDKLDTLNNTLMHLCGERGADLDKVFHDRLHPTKQLYLQILTTSQR